MAPNEIDHQEGPSEEEATLPTAFLGSQGEGADVLLPPGVLGRVPTVRRVEQIIHVRGLLRFHGFLHRFPTSGTPRLCRRLGFLGRNVGSGSVG